MSWIRAHRRFGGTLALFALALQLALSFGHVHARDLAGIPGSAVAQAQVTVPHGPDGDAADQANDIYCAVCATVALSGNVRFAGLAGAVATFKFNRLYLIGIGSRIDATALTTRYFQREHLPSSSNIV